MIYNITSTDEMDRLLHNCVKYLLEKFESEQAAKHLLDGVSQIYDNLESNPNIRPQWCQVSLKFYKRLWNTMWLYHSKTIKNQS